MPDTSHGDHTSTPKTLGMAHWRFKHHLHDGHRATRRLRRADARHWRDGTSLCGHLETKPGLDWTRFVVPIAELDDLKYHTET